jgi:hypothetical protein
MKGGCVLDGRKDHAPARKTTPACRNFCEEDSLSWHSGVQARALSLGLHFLTKIYSLGYGRFSI